jgi:hypothetical protein
MLMNDSSNVMITIALCFTVRDSGEPISVTDGIHRRYLIKLHQERTLFDIVETGAPNMLADRQEARPEGRSS